MDKISPQQLKRWKNNAVGTVFFAKISKYIEDKENDLKRLDPMSVSQEELYKESIRLLTQIELAKDFNSMKIEDLYFNMEEEDDTTE